MAIRPSSLFWLRGLPYSLALGVFAAIINVVPVLGAQLRFLPPYRPDFNPIEMAFAKLKAFVRAARRRTFDQVCDLIAAALGLFTPKECRNAVRHCGYCVATTL
jgi:transposase